MRLKAADTGLSPDRALEYLRRIQHHRIRLNDGKPVSGVSPLDAQQGELLRALEVSQPAASKQLSLL